MVAVVVGILGMHALGAHGVTATASPEPAAAGHAVHVAANTVGHTVGDEGASGEDTHEHTAHAVMACMAVLAAMAGLAFALLARRRGTRVWAVLRAPVPAVVQRDLHVATSPPPAWRFSVLRC